MAFVFMQLMPISIKDLPLRIGALLYSFGVITIGLHLYSKYVRRKKVYEKLKEKFLLLPLQLKKVILGKDISQERVEIRKTIPAMNQLIYSTRNLKYLATEYGKVLYWFMMIFQRFDYFISSYDKNIEISKEEEKYLVKLAELLEFIGEKLSIEGNKESILKIEKFQMEEKNISYFQEANPHRGTGKAGYLFIRLLKQTAKDSALYLIHSSTHRGTGFGDRKFFTPFSPLLILFQDIHTHRLYSEHIALYQDL
jgi:hypothetical protein